MILISAQGLSLKASALPFQSLWLLHIYQMVKCFAKLLDRALHLYHWQHAKLFRHSNKVPHRTSMQIVTMCPSCRWTLASPLPSHVYRHAICGNLTALYSPVSHSFVSSESHRPKVCLPYTQPPANPTQPRTTLVVQLYLRRCL